MQITTKELRKLLNKAWNEWVAPYHCWDFGKERTKRYRDVSKILKGYQPKPYRIKKTCHIVKEAGDG